MTAGQIAYREFLNSAFWKELTARKKAHVPRCEKCGWDKYLESHHKVYPKDWYDTKEEHLEVLCSLCHEEVEGLRKPKTWAETRREHCVELIGALHTEFAYNRPLRQSQKRLMAVIERLYPDDGCLQSRIRRTRQLAIDLGLY